MKNVLTKWISAGAMSLLLCACGGGVADGDYAGAFQEYAKSQLEAGTWVLTVDEELLPDQITAVQVDVNGQVTVADSLELARQEAVDAYVSAEKGLKFAMDEAEHNYKLDENSQFARRADYAKKIKAAQAARENDSKIEAYKQVMERIPQDHEAYVKFDKGRDYSYICLFEKAQTAYNDFVATSVEDYVKAYPAVMQYVDRDSTEVLGVKGDVSFTTPSGTQMVKMIFNEKPTFVKGIVAEEQEPVAEELGEEVVE